MKTCSSRFSERDGIERTRGRIPRRAPARVGGLARTPSRCDAAELPPDRFVQRRLVHNQDVVPPGDARRTPATLDEPSITTLYSVSWFSTHGPGVYASFKLPTTRLRGSRISV